MLFTFLHNEEIHQMQQTIWVEFFNKHMCSHTQVGTIDKKSDR